MKGKLYSRLWNAFENLDYEEQTMLSQHLSFFPECHSVFNKDTTDLNEYAEPKKKMIPKMMYTDIATDHGYSSANTANRICSKALRKLRETIIEQL